VHRNQKRYCQTWKHGCKPKRSVVRGKGPGDIDTTSAPILHWKWHATNITNASWQTQHMIQGYNFCLSHPNKDPARSDWRVGALLFYMSSKSPHFALICVGCCMSKLAAKLGWNLGGYVAILVATARMKPFRMMRWKPDTCRCAGSDHRWCEWTVFVERTAQMQRSLHNANRLFEVWYWWQQTNLPAYVWTEVTYIHADEPNLLNCIFIDSLRLKRRQN